MDLLVRVLLLDLMSTAVPPEKLPRLRTARNWGLAFFGISLIVLGAQLARRHGWLAR